MPLTRTLLLRQAYLRIVRAYGKDTEVEQGDFSERLLGLVDEIVSRKNAIPNQRRRGFLISSNTTSK
jgi:hypothetical protein